MVPILSGLTTNEYTVKDSFAFAKEVLNQDASLYMASLDVDSLFTNIPLEETINICVNGLFNNTDTVEGLSRRDFKELLTLAVSESYFVFNGKCYKQVDGVAMGSPLGPTLANAFLCYHEKNWLENCPLSFMPLHYRRYVDDIFVLFRSKEHVSLFKDYLSSRHPNINFSSEEESGNKMPFLDVSIERVNGHFATSVYRKPTFSGLYTNFVSFIPISYKIGLVSTLIFRCFSICSDMSRFHEELVKLKQIFKNNGYPQSLVEKCIRLFFDKLFSVRENIITVRKKDLIVVIPYLGKLSLQTRSRLSKICRDSLPCCKLQVIFKSSCRLSNFFKFKDRVPHELLSGVVYKFMCGRCNATYIGKTKRHLRVRASEHLGRSALTGKNAVSSRTAVKDHLFTCDYSPCFDDFNVLASSNKNFRLKLMESIYISRDNPILNRTLKSTPLYLFN